MLRNTLAACFFVCTLNQSVLGDVSLDRSCLNFAQEKPPIQTTPFLIAIGGGSGAGKSTIVEMIREESDEEILVLSMDNYYKDLSHIPEEKRATVNFDDPASFDSELLFEHLGMLLAGQVIERPTYDFVSHTRAKNQSVCISPKSTIILDGIFALSFPKIRELTGLKVYLDVDQDLRFIRRLQRDIRERGRTVESVVEQYLQAVRPMHSLHILPTRSFADLLVSWESMNTDAVKSIASFIRQHHVH